MEPEPFEYREPEPHRNLIYINFKTGTFICIYLKIGTSPEPIIFCKGFLRLMLPSALKIKINKGALTAI
jgi:hypothetical protein